MPGSARGHEVTVVEARDRVGGRTEGLVLDDGTPLELGGQWLGEGHTRMYELAGELGLSTFRTWNDEGQLLLDLQGRRSRTKPGKGAVPRISPFALADLAQGLLRFARLAARTDLERPWLTPGAEVLDGQTWESWIRRNLRTKAGARTSMSPARRCGPQASDLPGARAVLHDSDATWIRLWRSTGSAAGPGDRRIGRVAEAWPLRSARVLLGARTRIEHDGQGVRVMARDGSLYRGELPVSAPDAGPPAGYDPPLPSWRDQLTQRMPAGSVIKTYAIYPEPFWRQDGLNGQAVSDTGPVKVTFDNSPPSGTPGVLMGFLEGKQARIWARHSPAERREAVLGCFVRYFGQAAARPAQYLERDWMAEEYTRGCYGAHFAPGVWTSYGEAWRAPIGRIHWAGTECAPQWNGYMEGAVRSGEAAADAVGAH